MKEKKQELRVVFWHNDFPDGSRKNSYFGKDGPIFKRAFKNLSEEKTLNWKFHGGFIGPDRINLLRRLKKADVLISAYPWNMDIANDKMHWLEAEESLLKILTEIKKENKKLKIFFLHEPHHLIKEFKKIGKIARDVHDDIIYDYFLEK